MKELVEKIFEIEFNELEDFNFPVGELFGLVVNLDNVKYEFLINLVENSDFLLTIGSGAFNPNTKHDRNRPWFNRWTWLFKESRIFYNDPTLYLSPDIYGPWCVGTEDDWYLEKIANIIKIIAKNINIPNEHLISFGSSSGGFTSLYLSILIKNSIALAEIPQFDVTSWGNHWRPIKEACFPPMSDEKFIEQFGYRFKLLEFIKREKFIPNAYIILDCSAIFDYEKQYVPFFNQLDNLPYKKESNTLKFIINGKNEGHAPLPMREILKIITNIETSCYNNEGKNSAMLSDNEELKKLIEKNATLNNTVKKLNEVNVQKNIHISCLDDEIAQLKKGNYDYSKLNIPEDVSKLQNVINDKNNIIHYLDDQVSNLKNTIDKQTELLESMTEENKKLKETLNRGYFL